MILFSITAIAQEQVSTLTFHDNFEDEDVNGGIAQEKVLIQLVLTFTTTHLLLKKRLQIFLTTLIMMMLMGPSLKNRLTMMTMILIMMTMMKMMKTTC